MAATVSATGSVVATKQAKLVFANSGRIKEILVSVGDQVTAGQPLASLVPDASPDQARNGQIAAGHRAAQARSS